MKTVNDLLSHRDITRAEVLALASALTGWVDRVSEFGGTSAITDYLKREFGAYDLSTLVAEVATDVYDPTASTMADVVVFETIAGTIARLTQMGNGVNVPFNVRIEFMNADTIVHYVDAINGLNLTRNVNDKERATIIDIIQQQQAGLITGLEYSNKLCEVLFATIGQRTVNYNALG